MSSKIPLSVKNVVLTPYLVDSKLQTTTLLESETFFVHGKIYLEVATQIGSGSFIIRVMGKGDVLQDTKVVGKVGGSAGVELTVIIYDRAIEFIRADKAQTIAAPTGITSQVTYSGATSVLIFAQTAMQGLDTIGLLKFTMAMKLITKMRYINVEFGHIIKKFFSSLGEVSVANGNDIDTIIKSSFKSGGKFDEFRVPLDLGSLGVGYYLFYVYALSFVMMRFAVHTLKTITREDKTYPSWALTILGIIMKIHFSIFMTVGTDIGMAAVRFLLHKKSIIAAGFWSVVEGTLSVILIFLATFDLCYITETILNYDPKNKRIKSFHNSIWAPAISKDRAMLERARSEQYKDNIAEFYEVDAKSTAEGMLLNYSIVSFVVMDIPDIETAMQSKTYISAIVIFKLRFVLYQVFMVTLQTFPSMCLLTIGITELIMVILFIPNVCRFKGVISKFILGEKIAIGLLVVSFCCYCMINWLSQSELSKGKPVDVNIQSAMLGIFLISIFLEYVFLINTIIAGIINYCKGRKISQDSRMENGIGDVVYVDRASLYQRRKEKKKAILTGLTKDNEGIKSVREGFEQKEVETKLQVVFFETAINNSSNS